MHDFIKDVRRVAAMLNYGESLEIIEATMCDDDGLCPSGCELSLVVHAAEMLLDDGFTDVPDRDEPAEVSGEIG